MILTLSTAAFDVTELSLFRDTWLFSSITIFESYFDYLDLEFLKLLLVIAWFRSFNVDGYY